MFHRVRSSINHLFNRRPLSPDSISLLIFGIALLAFSIKTLDQGFFHDDWHHIYYANFYGLDGLKQFLFFDSRPFAYLVYSPLFSLLGFSAFNWHVLVLVLRFLTILTFFGCLNLIWPNHKKENGLVAALFLIYPVFQVQPNSVSYALHWVTYLMFFLSLLLMILAVRRKKFLTVFSLLALFFEVFHLLMIEYFAGIELVRPFLLWFAFRDDPVRERVRKVFRYWLPYFVILLIYAVFRASFSQILGYDRNSPVILLGLFSDPIHSLVFLIQSSIRDLVDVLFTTWNATYDPAVIDFSVFTNVWIWGLAALTGLVSLAYFSLIRDQDDTENEHAAWARIILGLGLVFVTLGLLPTWISGRSFFQLYDLFDDRLALPSMFGASMVWVGGIFFLIRKQAHRYVILCTMLGLAVGLQLRTNVAYAQGWQKQEQFYWQLYWRAPYIQPGTALISEGEILPLMGIHPTSYAVNSLYPPQKSMQEFNYAFFASGERIGDWEEFLQGSTLIDERFGSAFEGSSRDTLTILYAPENDQCLWILRPEDARIRNMPSLTYEFLPVSNLDRIQRIPLSDQYPPRNIFGDEPVRTWCFYFQKADLARQYEDWPEVTKLWDEAQQNGFLPGNGAEYIVFIEGFANTNDWGKASDLTITSSKYGDNIRPALCEFWGDLVLSLPASSEKENAYHKISEKLQCDN
jgi:hypothetical protein